MATGPYNNSLIQEIERQIDQRLSSVFFANKKKVELKIHFFNPTTLPLSHLILRALQQRYLQVGWKKVKISQAQGRTYLIYLKA